VSRDRLVFDPDVLDRIAQRAEAMTGGHESRLDALAQCIEELPANHRKLIDLRYRAGATLQQLAEGLGRTENAVTVALHRVRTTLAECIRKRIGQEAVR
jgi:RNA polymerase sigma-70 factor (ECF subfamily)